MPKRYYVYYERKVENIRGMSTVRSRSRFKIDRSTVNSVGNTVGVQVYPSYRSVPYPTVFCYNLDHARSL